VKAGPGPNCRVWLFGACFANLQCWRGDSPLSPFAGFAPGCGLWWPKCHDSVTVFFTCWKIPGFRLFSALRDGSTRSALGRYTAVHHTSVGRGRYEFQGRNAAAGIETVYAVLGMAATCGLVRLWPGSATEALGPRPDHRTALPTVYPHSAGASIPVVPLLGVRYQNWPAMQNVGMAAAGYRLQECFAIRRLFNTHGPRCSGLRYPNMQGTLDSVPRRQQIADSARHHKEQSRALGRPIPSPPVTIHAHARPRVLVAKCDFFSLGGKEIPRRLVRLLPTKAPFMGCRKMRLTRARCV
jgi:hypothetical protein